jgi:hypothetical protein
MYLEESRTRNSLMCGALRITFAGSCFTICFTKYSNYVAYKLVLFAILRWE